MYTFTVYKYMGLLCTFTVYKYMRLLCTFTVYKYMGMLCTHSLSISTCVCYVHIHCL